MATGLIALAALSDRYQAYRAVPLPRPAEMEFKAKGLLRKLGYTDPPRYSASAYSNDLEYLLSLRQVGRSRLPESEREHLAAARPALAVFFYRESPRLLGPVHQEGITGIGRPVDVSPDNPPNTVPGMAGVVLDTHGRLVRLTAVPNSDRRVCGLSQVPDRRRPGREADPRESRSQPHHPAAEGPVVFGLSGKDVGYYEHASYSGKARERDQLVKSGGVWFSDGPVPALVEIPSLKTEFADYSYVRLFDGPMRGKLVAVERRAVGTEKVALLLDVYKQETSATPASRRRGRPPVCGVRRCQAVALTRPWWSSTSRPRSPPMRGRFVALAAATAVGLTGAALFYSPRSAPPGPPARHVIEYSDPGPEVHSIRVRHFARNLVTREVIAVRMALPEAAARFRWLNSLPPPTPAAQTELLAELAGLPAGERYGEGERLALQVVACVDQPGLCDDPVREKEAALRQFRECRADGRLARLSEVPESERARLLAQAEAEVVSRQNGNPRD